MTFFVCKPVFNKVLCLYIYVMSNCSKYIYLHSDKILCQKCFRNRRHDVFYFISLLKSITVCLGARYRSRTEHKGNIRYH